MPDSKGSNKADANTMSEWLNGMEVNSSFIAKNPNEHRTVTDAKSREERLDILQHKFIFDFSVMPRQGKILLYDDKVSSGDTLDAVASAIRSQEPQMEIAALTKHVFTGAKVSSPEVAKLTTTPNQKASVEQPEQA